MCRHRAIRSVLVIDCQYTSESAIYRTCRFVILKRLYATTLVVSDACLATVTRNLCRTVRGITTECSHCPTRHGILRRCDFARCSDEMRTQRTVIVVLNRRYRLLPGDCRNCLRRPVGAVPRVLCISFGGYSLLQIRCCIPRARSRTP